MGDEAFNESILTEKLSKLNSSQQSIESLSRWCISHRKKAKQVVETWETLFNSAPRGQQISLLYLANDILQNSRRKGSEFVNEFWKVLPTALKNVYDSGEENCRKVATRLVNIWEERKVFGSRGQNLKNEMLGKNPSLPKNSSTTLNPSPVINGKNANPIKVLKRDDNSLRIKLAIGGLPEKILSALQLVHDEYVNEELALNKCRTAVSCVQEIEKDVATQGSQLGNDVVDNIEQHENTLLQCISQLEKIEANRVALVSQLRDAIQDQESKLELIRSELLAARGQIEQAANVRIKLASAFLAPTSNQTLVELTFPPALPMNNPALPTLSHPPTTSLNPAISDEESKRAAAAAVAAKLTASTSSAEMLTSVLSSLVAEEVASMSGGLKRPKLEKPMLFTDAHNSEGANPTYFPAAQQAAANVPPVQSTTQLIPQMNQLQPPFIPPPPLPPVAPPASSTGNQLNQPPMMGLAYGYAAGNLPPPPLSSNLARGFRPGPPPQQPPPQQLQNQQQQSQQPHQQVLANGVFYNPVVVGFYGQNHQPATPPVNRQ